MAASIAPNAALMLVIVAVTRGFSPPCVWSSKDDHQEISGPVGTHIFQSRCCLWRTGTLKLCLGAGNSGQLRRFGAGRRGTGICGHWRRRQNRHLAAVIDPLVVRGTNISAMAYAWPLHYLWDFVMTPERPRVWSSQLS